MTGSEITTTIQTKLNMKDGRSRASKLDTQFVLTNLDYYRTQDRDFFRAYEMASGIMWAYKTGRLTVQAEATIRSMNALQFARLIGKASDNCKVQGDIPGWLNSTLS
jgi:hypothetical protein